MRESSTYQAILDEGRAEGLTRGRAEGLTRGRAEEARALVLELGSQRYGAPTEQVRATLLAISDPHRLHSLARRLLDVSSWNELLDLP